TTAVATEPTPASGTAIGAPATGAIVSVALRTPPPDGANDTVAVVDAPGVSGAAPGAVPENRAASAPALADGGRSGISDALTCVMVTVALAVVPDGTMAKSIGDGDAVARTGAGETLTVNDADPVQPLTAVAWTVNGKDPVVVGVPDSTPPLPSVRPGG